MRLNRFSNVQGQNIKLHLKIRPRSSQSRSVSRTHSQQENAPATSKSLKVKNPAENKMTRPKMRLINIFSYHLNKKMGKVKKDESYLQYHFDML